MVDFTIRPLKSADDYRACLRLQKETWGEAFTECVPPSLLMVGQKLGGLSAGAFSSGGELLGFVFGLTGVKDGRLVHWSDMLAVKPAARDLGLGKRLKLYQRQHCLELGIETIYWTYDPLEARNAHLNINKLGANIDEYVPDMYVSSDSVLHRGLAMDRFVVAWRIAGARVEEALAGRRAFQHPAFVDAPIANTRLDSDGRPEPVDLPLPTEPLVRVEIPEDIQQCKAESLQRGIAWRANTRRVFLQYLPNGYEVDAFYRDAESHRCFYVLRARS